MTGVTVRRSTNAPARSPSLYKCSHLDHIGESQWILRYNEKKKFKPLDGVSRYRDPQL